MWGMYFCLIYFLIEFVIISASVINVLFKTDIVVEFGDNKKWPKLLSKIVWKEWKIYLSLISLRGKFRKTLKIIFKSLTAPF